MSRCIFDINDVGIQISDHTGILRVSPGFAFAYGGELLTGEQAAARIRSNPRAGYDGFWSRLDQQPLPRAVGTARSNADLAWYHLRDLWTPIADQYEQVILTVGGDYDAERLSTLLGITRACNMPVCSVVSSAVVAAASHVAKLQISKQTPAPELLVLDAQWHRLLAESVQISAHEVQSGGSAQVIKHGVAALYNRWAQMLAEAFLQRTRFDPLHSAASEQQLFDAMPGWLRQLADQEQIHVTLTSGQHDFSIDLEREQFSSVAAGLYRPLIDLVAAAGKPVLLRHKIALLPGLQQLLSEHGQVHLVSDASINTLLLERAGQLIAATGDEVVHHRSLPLADGAARSVTSASSNPDSKDSEHGEQAREQLRVTHIADSMHVWPLDGDCCSLRPQHSPAPGRLDGAAVLQRHGDELWFSADGGQQIQLNEHALAHRQQVHAGDRIRLGQAHYLLLNMPAGHSD